MQLQPFYPGNSPCAGACSLEWAAEQLEVDVETPITFDLPVGTTISWMSYGKGGEPYGYHASLFTVQHHTVMGYMLPDGSYLAQFWECGNWAIVHPVFPTPVPVSLYDPVDNMAQGYGGVSGFAYPLFPVSYQSKEHNVTEIVKIINKDVTNVSVVVIQPPDYHVPGLPPVEAIPLPAGGLLLLCALLMLRMVK